MGKKDDDAKNWSYGDMLRNEQELEEIRVEVHRTYEADETKANELLDLAAKACKNAGNGRLASKKRSGKGWVIIVTEPKKKRR